MENYKYFKLSEFSTPGMDNGDKMDRDFVATSSHLKGVAADISCTNSKDRIRLIEIAIKHNIRRIGVAHNFLHFDDDKDKPIACWTY